MSISQNVVKNTLKKFKQLILNLNIVRKDFQENETSKQI